MISLLLSLQLSACKTKEEEPVNTNEPVTLNDGKINGTDIGANDIAHFYYTYENINYNAFYQRYHFYTEDGKTMFFHETREVKNDYGPAEENDRTKYGTIELSENDWARFFDLIKDGTAKNREENIETGGRGPWMYIYTDDTVENSKEYHFASYEAQTEFVAFCEELADR